jgi:hypothetical protein
MLVSNDETLLRANLLPCSLQAADCSLGGTNPSWNPMLGRNIVEEAPFPFW